MASSMMTSVTVSAVNRTTPAQASMVAPFTGLKSASAFPVTKKPNNDITSLPSNGGRVQCIVIIDDGRKKYKTPSYLPPLSKPSLAKEVDYLIVKGWIPCLKFETEHGFVYREHKKSPEYYDGRYWTMWKQPMFGCTDSSQVLKELDECVKEYPNAFVRIIGFDNKREVECISFIANKPAGF